MKTSPWQQQWDRLIKEENSYLKRNAEKGASNFNFALEEKVPQKLQDTLQSAFRKAFELVFEKGTHIIEKTYQRDALERSYKINRYAIELKED